MTSYEWEPGNVYGEYHSPKYNALSYTWGRFEIRDPNELPEIKAITIHAAPWSIPRIRPSHFSSAEFAEVIADTADTHPEASLQSQVEFLWLDIACIDQTPGSHTKAREIGRQAKIFRGAHQVFVWLNTHSRLFYVNWANKIEPLFQSMCSPKFYTHVDIWRWITEVRDLVDAMVADPWFSSLWTLQETFLAPEATIIPSDAGKASLPLIGLSGAITETFASFRGALTYNDETRQMDQRIGLTALIDKTGLLVCHDRNAIALLAAASSRTTVKEEDRVCGIMQVFDFRLGNSAPNVSLDQRFTLEELNDQLGAALLEKEPMMSQLFICQTIVPPGKGWRHNRNSKVPSEVQNFYHRRRTQPELRSRARLSTERFHDSLWGRFAGRTLKFSIFYRNLRRDWPNAWVYGSAIVLLDNEILADCPPKRQATSLGRAAYLALHRPEPIILLLGLQAQPENSKDVARRLAVGLLLEEFLVPELLCSSSKVWKRIGLLMWDISSERLESEAIYHKSPYEAMGHALDTFKKIVKDLPYLSGHVPDWKYESGLFG